jgi:hypothetical protein
LWLKPGGMTLGVGLRAGVSCPLGEVSSHANLPIGPRLSLGGVGAKLGLRNGDKGAGAGGSNAERWVSWKKSL